MQQGMPRRRRRPVDRRKLLSGTTEICSAVLGPKGVRTAVTQTAFSQTGQQDSDYHITLPVSLSISDAVTTQF